jgi:pyruvate formate lyase activating enzyme
VIMRIGGIQKNSLIDYPSRISCVIFTLGCDFDCPYCHNPELVKPSPGDKGIDIREVFAFLKKRRPFLDGVVITGGEPTLQNDLFPFCRRIKDLGYPVKLDTNGSRPDIVNRLMREGLVDYIAMDIKTDPNRYVPIIVPKCDPDDIRSSIGLILKSGLPHEFRTTCIKPIIDEDAIRTISQMINDADLFALQKVQTGDVLHPEFFNGYDRYYDDNDLQRFQSIAASNVKSCIIR